MADEYKVWMGGLSWQTDDQKLRDAVYAKLGSNTRISSVKVVYDLETNRSKGYAFVGFATPALAEDAIDLMHDMDLDGRRIIVKKAEARPPRAPFDRPARDQHGGSGSDRDYRAGGGGSGGPKRGFRVAVSGLPESYTWRELKDFLRGNNLSISYATILRPGHGVGDYESEEDREAAIRKLDNKELEQGSVVRVKRHEDAGPSGGGGGGGGGGSSYEPRSSGRDRERDPYASSYGDRERDRGDRDRGDRDRGDRDRGDRDRGDRDRGDRDRYAERAGGGGGGGGRDSTHDGRYGQRERERSRDRGTAYAVERGGGGGGYVERGYAAADRGDRGGGGRGGAGYDDRAAYGAGERGGYAAPERDRGAYVAAERGGGGYAAVERYDERVVYAPVERDRGAYVERGGYDSRAVYVLPATAVMAKPRYAAEYAAADTYDDPRGGYVAAGAYVSGGGGDRYAARPVVAAVVDPRYDDRAHVGYSSRGEARVVYADEYAERPYSSRGGGAADVYAASDRGYGEGPSRGAPAGYEDRIERVDRGGYEQPTSRGGGHGRYAQY